MNIFRGSGASAGKLGMGMSAEYRSEATPETSPLSALRNRATLLRSAVLVAITVLLLWTLVDWVGTTDVVGSIQRLGSGHLAVVTLLTLVLPVSHAWRLQAALAATDHRLSFRRAFDLTLAVWPISSLTPAKSGDLVKAY